MTELQSRTFLDLVACSEFNDAVALLRVILAQQQKLGGDASLSAWRASIGSSRNPAQRASARWKRVKTRTVTAPDVSPATNIRAFHTAVLAAGTAGTYNFYYFSIYIFFQYHHIYIFFSYRSRRISRRRRGD